MKEILSLARLTGLEQEELAEKLKSEEGEFREDALQVFESLAIEHSKQRAKQKADQFHQKGYGEAAAKVEEKVITLLSEKFGVKASKVEEIADELGSKFKALEEQAKAAPSSLTPDEIKGTEIFKRTLKELVEQEVGSVKSEKERLEQEAVSAKTALQTYKEQQAIKSALEPVLNSAAANFGPSASKTWDYFFHTVPTGVKDGKIVFLNERGEVLEDKYGDPLSAKEYLIEQGNWPLGFTAPKKPNTPGASSNASPASGTIKHFKDAADYHAQVAAAGNNTKAIAELGKKYMEQLRAGGFK